MVNSIIELPILNNYLWASEKRERILTCVGSAEGKKAWQKEI
jgi:hypothetical protein